MLLIYAKSCHALNPVRIGWLTPQETANLLYKEEYLCHDDILHDIDKWGPVELTKIEFYRDTDIGNFAASPICDLYFDRSNLCGIGINATVGSPVWETLSTILVNNAYRKLTISELIHLFLRLSSTSL